jgi:hypothetical protein
MTLGRPPIDPIDDLAWSRIERGVWATLDERPEQPPPSIPRTRSMRWPAIAVVIATVAAIAIVLAWPRDEAALTAPVAVAPSPAPAPPPPPAPIAPVRVVAGATPSAASFGDVHVELEPRAAMTIAPDGATAQVPQDDGSIKEFTSSRSSTPAAASSWRPARRSTPRRLRHRPGPPRRICAPSTSASPPSSLASPRSPSPATSRSPPGARRTPSSPCSPRPASPPSAAIRAPAASSRPTCAAFQAAPTPTTRASSSRRPSSRGRRVVDQSAERNATRSARCASVNTKPSSTS